MKKIHIPVICLLLAFFAATAFAASLILEDKDAGYSITLPEGWEPADAPALQKMAEGASSMVPDSKIKEAIAKKAQGAMLKGTTPPQYVVVVPIPNAAMNITDKDLAELQESGSTGLKEFEQGMSSALKRGGASMGDTRMFKDGISVSARFALPGGTTNLYQISQVRFTKNNILLIMGIYPGGDNDHNNKDMQAILDSTVIAPETRLSSPESSAATLGKYTGLLLLAAAAVYALNHFRKKKQA